MAAGEETAVADAMGAARQGVQQELADVLLGGERRAAGPVATAVVLDGQDAVVGEGRAAGVATDLVLDFKIFRAGFFA